mgnify:CR=1 FL=1
MPDFRRRFPGVIASAFGHLGDGNVHFHVRAASHASPDWYEREGTEITRLVDDLVTDAGGSISAEHGIGQLKRDELARITNGYSPAMIDHLKRQHRQLIGELHDIAGTLQFTTVDEAIVHCTKGLGIWRRASTDAGEELPLLRAADLPLAEEVSAHLLGMKGKMFRPTLVLLASAVARWRWLAGALGKLLKREFTVN